ncbi:hypothetical protein [Novipirellula sp.]|uniref:hypothetical protein n=1 Tax=Novipirellula sp. TaxID=2795430 RepID=UPI003566DFAD
MTRELCRVVSLFTWGCMTGCGETGPTNAMDNADEQAIADSKAELEREQAMLEADEE